MFKKLSVLIVFMGIFAVVFNTFAMNKGENRLQGKISSINGNVITIKDSEGGVTVLEVRSTAGLGVGASAWCEEDCGKTLNIGSSVINVQKVIKQRSWGDPHVHEKVAR